jgi:hypothetical protein
MADRYIYADDLRLSLVAHRAHRYTPGLRRIAAMSNTGFTTHRCDGSRRSEFEKRWAVPPLIGLLRPSVPVALVRRVRLLGGLDEVRRTWGMGLRALVSEIENGEWSSQ